MIINHGKFHKITLKEKRSNLTNIKIKTYKICVEIYKTLNNINPSFIKDLFELGESDRPVRDKYKSNLTKLK